MIVRPGSRCGPNARRVFALGLAACCCALTGTARSDVLPSYDPTKGYGDFDIWVARPLPDGGFETPVNLGPTINTRRREITPLVSWNGDRLFFAARHREDCLGEEDLYVSQWVDGAWGPAVNMGESVNTVLAEIGPCLMPDGATLFYSRRDAAQLAYDLIMTVQFEDEWLTPLPVGEPIYSPADERLCSITADGKQLFFTAQRNSGYGSFDLYVAFRDDDGIHWTDPINLGAEVNSRESDYSPGVSPDGKRLFFSSQRHEPGNFDLYLTEYREGRWTTPVRLPEPINSRFTEYCPSIGPDGSLYFASDRREAWPDLKSDFEE